MSNNLTRKGLAVSTGLALALTSLVGIAAPASAAPGDVTISPATGDTWAVFNDDTFVEKVSYPRFLIDETTLGSSEMVPMGLALTNEDAQAFAVSSPVYAFGDGEFAGWKVDSAGSVSVLTYAELPTLPSSSGFVVDFGALDAVRIHLTFGYSLNDELSYEALVYQDDVISNDIQFGPYGYNYATYGDGDFALGVQKWFETGLNPTNTNFLTIEPNFASKAETINFYDPKTVTLTPRIERFVASDEGTYKVDLDDTGYAGFSLGFSKRVNLNQLNLSSWNARLIGTDYETDYAVSLDGMYPVLLAGDDTADDRERLYFWPDTRVSGGESYRVSVKHSGAAAADRSYTSGGFRVPEAPASNDYSVYGASVVSVDEVNSVYVDDTNIALRAGVKSFAFLVQALEVDNSVTLPSDDDTAPDALAVANIPVMFYLEAGYLAAGATISVNGSPINVTQSGGALIANALTNSKGQATFTVTHSSAIAKSAYFVEVTAVDENGAANWVGEGDYVISYPDQFAQVTYETTAVAAITPDSELVSGAKVSLTFSVTDQFDQPISKSGTKALNVLLSGSDPDDLELSAAVDANGDAKFSFDSYLEVGETDLLLAEVFTGNAAAPVRLGISADVDLFNTATPASISVSANATAEVTYLDFITGAGTTAQKAAFDAAGPTGVAPTYTGSVLDANGAGIPGALVTVAGTGFQFRKVELGVPTGSYFKDSITLVADSQGQFSVQYWVHEASATGKTLTVTSGGKTATTTVKSYLPTGLDGDNLKFELVMPKNVVKNTTYALVAKLTDKWGNPVATTTNGDDTYGVTFQGAGSIQINSTDAEVRRNFGRDGTVTVFMRSVKDIAGPGSVLATLGAANYKATSGSTNSQLDIAEVSTDAPSTVWDETKFENSLEVEVEVLETAPASGKVNVGSFNGKLVVYAAGLQGSTISWKVGGVWGKQVATSNYSVFDRPTPRRGVTVTVDIYVNGVKQLTKSVVTR